jgi:serine protease Do
MRRPLLGTGIGLGLTLVLASLAPDGPSDPQVGKSFKVPYKISGTNHFMVRVRINGKGPFNFLVDTGAPALIVSTEAAKDAGLKTADDEFWAPVDRVDFEGGATLRGMKARVDDPFQLIGMNALGLPGVKIDGLLGYTMLARYKVELDPTKDRMVWTRLDFEPREPFIPKGAIAKQAPGELAAMNMLGPLAKGLSFLVGKQEPDLLLPRGFLGVALEPGNGPAKVAGVLEGSAAAKAGLKAGDVLTKIGDKSVDSAKAAHAAVALFRPGSKVELRVQRGDRTIELNVVAGEGF